MEFTVSLRNVILPLIVLAFVGVAVNFLAPIFTTSTRWLVLSVVMLYVIAVGHIWRPLRTRFAIISLIYGIWGVATMIWSEVPLLSAMKSGAFIMVSLTCLVAGYNWGLKTPPEKLLDFLMPLTVAALLAGVLGKFSTTAVDYAGDMALYQGLVNGANMFGSMLAMCSPYLFWKVYFHWGRIRKRMFWLSITLVELGYLVAASSRGAILIVLITMAGMFLSLSLGKRLQIFILTFSALGILFISLPDQFEQLQQKLIYKHATRTQGVFYTRQDVWNVTYEKAKEGGWFGGGYGISIGDKSKFQFGLTAEKYGREKGNAQLAIIEETGIIGFVLYAASLFFLFARLINAVRRWPSGPEKVVIAITTSTLIGMIVGSCFEAWWVAPGAPESVYFWVITGVALGYSSTRPLSDHELAKPVISRRLVDVQNHGHAPTVG